MNPNFGEELTLYQCLEILRETNPSSLPERAKFWENHMDELQDHFNRSASEVTIEDTKFRIVYYARISVYEPYMFGKPFAWIQIGENGSDPQSSNRDHDNSNDTSDTDV